MSREFNAGQYILDKAANIMGGAFSDNEADSYERRKQAIEVQGRLVKETFENTLRQYELEKAAKEAADGFSAQGDWNQAFLSSKVGQYHAERRLESINKLKQLGGYPTPENYSGSSNHSEADLALYNTWLNNRFPSLVGPDRNEIRLTDGSYGIFTEY